MFGWSMRKQQLTGTRMWVTVSENFTLCFSPGALELFPVDSLGVGKGGSGNVKLSSASLVLWMLSQPEHWEHDEWEHSDDSVNENPSY